MAKLTAIGRNVIIRKSTLETTSSSGIVLQASSLDENITGVVMALPEFSYHPNGDIKPQTLEVGDTVGLMRGKVGTTLPQNHIPDEYSSDDKDLWVAVSEELIIYKVKGTTHE